MKLRLKTSIIFVVLAMTYIAVNLLASPPKSSLQHYHVSAATLHALNATVIIPVIIIWYIGLLGYEKLRAYSNLLKGNREGAQVSQLTKGVMVLAWWLPISSTLSSLLSWFGKEHGTFVAPVTIIIGFLSLLFPLVGSWFLNRACRDLGSLAKLPLRRGGLDILFGLTISAGVFYAYLVANAKDSIFTTYHMPLLVVMLSLVIPYIFSWYLGLLAVYDLHRYSLSVKGIIYRKAWNRLALGIGWIVVFSILLQYFTAVSVKFGTLSLAWALAVIYLFLPIMALGYVLLASGAKQLTKIEEV